MSYGHLNQLVQLYKLQRGLIEQELQENSRPKTCSVYKVEHKHSMII